MAVEEPPILIAVERILGDIEIEDDLFGGSTPDALELATQPPSQNGRLSL